MKRMVRIRHPVMMNQMQDLLEHLKCPSLKHLDLADVQSPSWGKYLKLFPASFGRRKKGGSRAFGIIVCSPGCREFD